MAFDPRFFQFLFLVMITGLLGWNVLLAVRNKKIFVISNLGILAGRSYFKYWFKKVSKEEYKSLFYLELVFQSIIFLGFLVGVFYILIHYFILGLPL